MNERRPSEIKFGSIKKVNGDRPIEYLRRVSSRINILTKAFKDCPENYCNDYHNASILVQGLMQDLAKIATALEEHECGGCHVCNKMLYDLNVR